MLNLLWIIVGIGLLLAGAEFLVRGSVRIALSLGLSPLVVGLTIVAFGTSSPEAAVSIWSSVTGQSGVAVGNVVGSNIFNILAVLGISAAIVPLSVSARVIRREVPLMIGASVVFWLLTLNGILGRIEGFILVALVVLYVTWLIRKGNATSPSTPEPDRQDSIPQRSASMIVWNLLIAGIGIVMLVAGSNRLVTGAAGIARLAGVSESVIGLTIVAAGTSLPELATSVVAAFRGERDIAVGNVIGSNVFNILFVLGMGALVTKEGLPIPDSICQLDVPVMLVVALLALPIMFSGSRISRGEDSCWQAIM